MRVELPQFEQVSAEARDFADAARRAGWLFEAYTECAREAWVVSHEEAARAAKRRAEEAARTEPR